MDIPTPEEVQCDDALRLLSRSLDGDLTRAETRQLSCTSPPVSHVGCVWDRWQRWHLTWRS